MYSWGRKCVILLKQCPGSVSPVLRLLFRRPLHADETTEPQSYIGAENNQREGISIMSEEQKNNGCTEESCAGCAHADSCSSKKTDFLEPANKYSHIKKVIGVVSGKGGVGKSLVTASLARMAREKGYNVGILDADITGPSIPKMYGVHNKAQGTEEGIFPCTAQDGTRIMSVNLLLPDEEAPVIWRGPIIAGVVKQFWTDVMWGDLDYLFVDMPPGTGDVPLTVFQSLPVDGVVIVTSPQDLVQMIVKKACSMATQILFLGLLKTTAT